MVQWPTHALSKSLIAFTICKFLYMHKNKCKRFLLAMAFLCFQLQKQLQKYKCLPPYLYLNHHSHHLTQHHSPLTPSHTTSQTYTITCNITHLTTTFTNTHNITHNSHHHIQYHSTLNHHHTTSHTYTITCNIKQSPEASPEEVCVIKYTNIYICDLNLTDNKS